MERTITASRAEVARRRRRRQKRNTTIFVTALIVLVILTVTVIACVAAFGGRDLGPETVPKNPAGVNPGEPQGDDAAPPAGDGTDEGENSGDGEADDGTDTEPQESDSDKISRLVAEADRLAASYDYDGAIELIKSYGADYAQQQALTDAIAGYESTKSTMVRYSDVTTIPHIFFHSLIADTSRAFDGDYDQDGYNLYMTTVYEFEHMMEEMYKRGYVLIRIHDMAYADPETGEFTAGDIMLPAGKKPFVLSVDDVNYYDYMTDSNDDHIPDAGGDGFATKIVIGDDGKPTCEYITADGQTVTGEYDVVPILDRFVEEHPDFSYRGAKGILAVTGYEGVFGYRTHPDWKSILGEEAWNQAHEDAKAVAQCLKDDGWEIASHSFGHPHYGRMDLDSFKNDVRKWEEQVEPIVGDTDILIYPFGDDISGVEGYSGPKYDTLMEAGFRYYCNVDSHDAWVQIHDKYMRQGRRNLDGYRLYWNPEMLDDLFDVNDVMDPNRPLPVPSL